MHFAGQPTAQASERDEDKKLADPRPRPHSLAPEEGGRRHQRTSEWQAYNSDVLVALLNA